MQITWDEFETEYTPVRNPFDDNAAYDGYMFETYGIELAAIQDIRPEFVWTIIDSDEGLPTIVNGFHFVDRLGYLTTRNPWSDPCIEVIDD